jgi:hypothetical protein
MEQNRGVSQDCMRLAAEKQARERCEREGVECRVFRRVGLPTPTEVTWYVRTPEEGDIPFPATLELVVAPSSMGAPWVFRAPPSE